MELCREGSTTTCSGVAYGVGSFARVSGAVAALCIGSVSACWRTLAAGSSGLHTGTHTGAVWNSEFTLSVGTMREPPFWGDLRGELTGSARGGAAEGGGAGAAGAARAGAFGAGGACFALALLHREIQNKTKHSRSNQSVERRDAISARRTKQEMKNDVLRNEMYAGSSLEYGSEQQ